MKQVEICNPVFASLPASHTVNRATFPCAERQDSLKIALFSNEKVGTRPLFERVERALHDYFAGAEIRNFAKTNSTQAAPAEVIDSVQSFGPDVAVYATAD